MKTLFEINFLLLFMCFGFLALTFFWWKASRKFFIFFFYFSENSMKLKKGSLQFILFNYGIFGPLGLASISGYFYVLITFVKFLTF